jgi:hypothetical protein
VLRRAFALLVLLSLPGLARAQDVRAPGDPAQGDAAPTDAGAQDAPQDAGEIEALRAIESKLAAAGALSDEERALPLQLAARGVSPRARALAAAVCAWLDPKAANGVLVRAAADPDALVRLTALQSLVSFARRLDEDERQGTLHAALVALDDPDDEVACAAFEVVQVLAPAAVPDAVRVRAAQASDLRYGCFARSGALPARPVQTPALPADELGSEVPTSPNADAAPPVAPVESVAAPTNATWLMVAIGASAGAVAGGALPGAFVLSRDILTYTPDRSRLVHEEISFGAQVLGAAVGSAVGGGAMYGLAQLSAPTLDDAATAALGAGAGMLMGGSLQLMLALEDAAAIGTFSGVAAGGLLVGGALAAFTALDTNDHVLAIALAGGGALATTLIAFTAVPVGIDRVGPAYRTDFVLGLAGASASALGLVGLGVGVLVDVPARRSVAALATGLVGAGLLGGSAFLVIPAALDVKSRVASGVALGGQLVGTVLGVLLLPDSLFSDAPAPGTALHLDLGALEGAGRVVRVGIPTVAPMVDARGQGIAASLLSGTF